MIPPLSPRALRTRWSLQRLSRCASAAGAPAAASPAGGPAAWGASNRGSPVIVPPASVRAAAVAPVSAAVTWSGTPAIDVASGVVDQLTGAGVPVEWIAGCAREEADLYSYRRDGRTGRFAGVIGRAA